MSQSIALVRNRRSDTVLYAFSLALLFLSMMTAPLSQALARGAPDSFADLAEQLSPAVVNISTVQMVETGRGRGIMPDIPPGSPLEEFFQDFFNQRRGGGEEERPQRTQSLGSGFIIDEGGYIVTNYHVIEDADEVTIRLHDGQELDAQIIGRDQQADLALLKIETDEDLVAVEFGDSDASRVGDWVLAIGNPFGLGGSVTAGIISARNRDLRAGSYDEFIQTDAPINRGNSGGPMFNMDGEVIGVNTAIFSPTGGNIGIGFAVPSNLAERVIDQLREYGYARRGYLGVTIRGVTDEIADALGLDEARGALVDSLLDDGPARASGIEPGDIILSFNDQPVADSRELAQIVSKTEIGKAVDVRIIRDGKERTIKVRTGELPREQNFASVEEEAIPDEPEVRREEVLGMALADLSAPLREEYELPSDVSGVVILDIDRRSAALERGLRPGDVIVQINREDVADPEAFHRMVEEARERGRGAVLVRMYRGGRFVHVTLPTNEQD